jgi:hypothetical protein
MADSIYSTPRALAEDVRLIVAGGGPLTDDENLTETEALYWLSHLRLEDV